MSGGLLQLVATGEQDMWLTGKPEVSFFRSSYKRYTHYSNSIERMMIQGKPVPGGMSTIRIEKKGDLLSYTYMTAIDPSGALVPNKQHMSTARCRHGAGHARVRGHMDRRGCMMLGHHGTWVRTVFRRRR